MNGFIKLDLKSIPDNDSWLAHSRDSEVQDLVINVSEAVSETGQPLTSELILTPTQEIYTARLSARREVLVITRFSMPGDFFL